MIDPSFWRGRRVFLTGHTGFKGGWLSLWLQSLGADVFGFALPPPDGPSFFACARITEKLAASTLADIRDLDVLRSAMRAAEPEIVLHLAAQPLVRRSYADPVETYSTNVIGLVNLFEAARATPGVRAIVNVTSDKCYENREWVWGYRENEPMGGLDPYSSSKGCAELVTSSYRSSFFHRPEGPFLASARAGNVIGGGDRAPDRLVPDILRALERSEPVEIRRPSAVRPWQHVLDPLSGYLLLAQRLHQEGAAFASAWNFGPAPTETCTVQALVEKICALFGHDAGFRVTADDGPHEAHTLALDCAKAHRDLGWAPKWPMPVALEKIVEWHRAYLAGDDLRYLSLRQIDEHRTADATTREAHMTIGAPRRRVLLRGRTSA